MKMLLWDDEYHFVFLRYGQGPGYWILRTEKVTSFFSSIFRENLLNINTPTFPSWLALQAASDKSTSLYTQPCCMLPCYHVTIWDGALTSSQAVSEVFMQTLSPARQSQHKHLALHWRISSSFFSCRSKSKSDTSLSVKRYQFYLENYVHKKASNFWLSQY